MTDVDIDAMTEAQAKAALKAMLAKGMAVVSEAREKMEDWRTSISVKALWAGQATTAAEVVRIVEVHART